MDFDAFTEGVEPGGLRSRTEIGILICYMLDDIGKPFSRDDLIGIFQEYGLANYFETVNALAELVKNDNVICSSDTPAMLTLTQNGQLISAQLNETLSLTTRQRATDAIAERIKRKKVEQENPVTITREKDGGYQVNLRITDGLRDLMSLTLFVPDIKETNAVKQHFHQNPQRFYSIILAAAVGEKSMLPKTLKELLS